MDALLTVQQAIQILDAIPVAPRMQTRPLDESLGFRLAAEILSDREYPPFNKSVMDGYAVRSVDTTAATTLQLIETIPAGATAKQTVGPHQAAAIMTGAALPTGADAVIRVEETTRDGNRVATRIPTRPGQNIALKGSDITANTLILSRGTKLTAAPIAVAASVGAATVSVFARPQVAVLSTGDELIEIDQTPAGSQIRNSNTHMLVALLQQLGCEVKVLPIAPDEPSLLREAIETGLQSQVLFITGGMSMGERDYVPNLLNELGLQLRITKLRIKPGKPFIFATQSTPAGDKFVFGLPGNPVSAYVCTLRLAARLLSRIAGGPAQPLMIESKLAAPLPANGPREFHLPAIFTGSSLEPLVWKGSADIYTFAHANALIIRAENSPSALAGDLATALPLPGAPFNSW